MVLLYWLALWVNWDMPKYGALAIALISLDTTGASLRKGLMRIAGTTVGLAVGMLGLSLFAQDAWSTLLFHASYLVIVGYFMQTSRYPYAWFVAGFLPSLVWATTYGKVDNAFHYAIFRYLETTAGIAIYTVVSTLLWPRQAGDQLAQQGASFCTDLQELLGLYHRQLKDGDSPINAVEVRNRLEGTLPKMLATLEAAYADTPSVVAKKRAWEIFRVDARAISDAMELWRQSIEDCRRLDLDRLLPEVYPSLETLDERFACIEALWRTPSVGHEANDAEDADKRLLEPLRLEVAQDRNANLRHLDRAALSSFVQQLTVLDVTSRELLRTMQVLVGRAPLRALKSRSLPPDLYQPSRWDPARLTNGLVPAASFIAAYFFWIYFDPPTGPSVPNMAATFGLLTVMTPMKALVLIPLSLVSVWGFVAPVYFLVMPRLDNGFQLLACIWAFAFAVGSLFVGRKAVLKTIILAMFVMMTGISNQQSYSFIGLVDGTLMIVLAVVIIGVVQALLSPLRPEQALLRNVRRFFHGCARVTGGFVFARPEDRSKGQRIRKRYFESMVLPAPGNIQKAEKGLDYKLYPDNTPEKVQRLRDSMQSIVYRLQALELSHGRISAQSLDVGEPFILLSSKLLETIQRILESWVGFETSDALAEQRNELQKLVAELEQHLDSLEVDSTQDDTDDPIVTGYTMLGSVRGLIESMAGTQNAMSQINWPALATTKF
jgi:uncharacterized membrane protein YccC